MRHVLFCNRFAMLTSALLVIAGSGHAGDLLIRYLPMEATSVPLTEPGIPPSVLLAPVIVTGKSKPETDESFKAAKDRIAAFGRRPTTEKGLLGALGFEFNTVRPQNTDANDKAALASQKGLATAGCVGCSIPENRLP